MLNINYIVAIISVISAFIFGVGVSAIWAAKVARITFEKRTLADNYYAFAVLSYTLNTIDYYCGNVLLCTDTFELFKGNPLDPGIYNGFIKNNILTIMDIDNDKTKVTYLDIGDNPALHLLVSTFPCIVIN